MNNYDDHQMIHIPALDFSLINYRRRHTLFNSLYKVVCLLNHESRIAKIFLKKLMNNDTFCIPASTIY